MKELAPPVLLGVIVKPGSKRPGISEADGMLVVRVRERAIDGAANAACIRALAAAYGVAPTAVELLRGARGRHKRFAIHRAEGTKGRP
jgi:hypothetical protein